MAAVAAALAIACSARHPPAADPETTRDRRTWEAEAREIHDRCPAFEAVYRGVWSRAGRRGRALRLWVAASGPDRLRVEVGGRLGDTWLVLVGSEGRILAVSPRLGEHLRGDSGRGWLRQASGLPLDPDECAGVLLGDLPVRLGLEARGADEAVRTLGPDGVRRRYLRHREPPYGDGDSLAIEEDGKRALEVRYEAWESHSGVRVPTELRLLDAGQSLSLRLEDLACGEPPAAAFDLSPPAGSLEAGQPAEGGVPPGWSFPGEGP